MPYPFVLPTTSHIFFQNNFSSSTHPSLPSTATSQRNILRSALKLHKRLSPSDQSSHLQELLSALEGYLRYLATIDYALSGRDISGEDVDLALIKDISVEWRPVLSSTNIPGRREVDRVTGQGLDYELYFVHHTYAIIQCLFARQALFSLYTNNQPSLTSEQRVALIQTALKHLKSAYAAHTYLVQRANSSPDGPPSFPTAAADVSPLTIQPALQRLNHAEFNLLAVLKDDPYPALVLQSRNAADREWMIKAPTIPKTRAQVLTRLCIGAAEHAAAASATLKSTESSSGMSLNKGKASKELIEYIDDLKRTAKARACRFQAIDADARGETGIAIAWLNAAFNELGIERSSSSTSTTSKDTNNKKPSSLSKIKQNFQERREDRKIAQGSISRWGIDAGRIEETRIVEWLERKMVKSNDTLSFQLVPDWKGLVGSLPGGMNMPITGDGQGDKWRVTVLSEDELAGMRSPVEGGREDGVMSSGDEDMADEERERQGTNTKAPAGSFPGTDQEYTSGYY